MMQTRAEHQTCLNVMPSAANLLQRYIIFLGIENVYVHFFKENAPPYYFFL